MRKQHLRTYAGYALALGTANLFTTSGILFASRLSETRREINAGLSAAGVGVGALIIDPADTATIYAHTYTATSEAQP